MGSPCRALLVVGAFMWLSGCAVGPDYEPPIVAVPNVFDNASPTSAVASVPTTPDFVRWWEVLHDRQLNALIERAVASNPDIEIMLTRVQEARSQEIVVLGAMLPTVGGSGTIAAGSGTDLTKGRVAQSIRAGDSSRDLNSISRMAGFDAQWELDLFGKYQRSLEAARDDAEAQLELRNAALITVIADVARNYIEIRGQQLQQEIARRNVATAQRTLDLVKARFDRGQSNELDLALAKRQLAIRWARLPDQTAAISAAKSRLALLLGTYSADIAEAQRPGKMPALPERLRPGVPVDLLRRRPDIRAAERELAAATARIGVATADLFPSVALTAGFGAQGGTRQEGAAGAPLHGSIWSVGPRAYWPLLDFGRLDALINIEAMRAHEALVKYKKTIIAAVEEVDQAIKQYHSDLQRLKALVVAREASRRAVDLATERYEHGVTDSHDSGATDSHERGTAHSHEGGVTDLRAVLDAQHQDYAIAEETAKAAEVVVLRYLAFYKALGGGWELYDKVPPLPPAQPAVIAAVRRLTAGWH